MAVAWNVLVVDDEEDMHGVTSLALRRKTWRGRPIELRTARNAREAREILRSSDAPNFHCALVDVVMESNDAGLQLCDYIRSTMPRTLRIVLRTGQPGAAPPDKVLNEYDIDYYLAKTEVTDDRLFAVLRACFRSSLDIGALEAVGGQLRAFMEALQSSETTNDELVALMRQSLGFLEEKYSANLAFVPDARHHSATLPGVEPGVVANAITNAYQQNRAPMKLHPGADLGLAGAFVVVTTAFDPVSRVVQAEKGVGSRLMKWFSSARHQPEEVEAVAGVAVQFERELRPRIYEEFARDLELFLNNWKVTDAADRLVDKMVRDVMSASIVGRP